MASGHTSAEIPFRLSSTTKWISGIAEDTTCRDILVAVLRAENILDCDEDIVHHHYALVETWRQVSKVLSPNSLIWKIWRAWDEEQPNVMFAVKRIKSDRRPKEVKEEGSKTEAGLGLDSRPRKSVKRRNSKIGSKHCVDTLHPRALNRSKQMMCRDIHDQMKKIINQGEIIRKHLETIKDYESLNEHSEQKIQSVEQPSEVRTFEAFQPTNISSDKSDNPSDSAFNDSFLESPPAGLSGAPITLSENTSPRNLSFERLSLGGPNPSAASNPGFQSDKQSLNKTVQKCQNTPASVSSSPRQPDLAPKKEPDLSDRDNVYNLLENIHRLNCLLESKEEEVLTLGSTVSMVGEAGVPGPGVDSVGVRHCFDDEISRYRDLNARLLSEIEDNSGQLADMVRSRDQRRKMVTQLEFDVNIIERESKRLQSDLTTIQSIGTNLPSSNSAKKGQTIHPETEIQSPRVTTEATQSPVSQPDPASSPRDKAVQSSPSYQGDRYSATKKMLEYGSDSSSDTGVCSLSSTEGDYSLSTLV